MSINWELVGVLEYAFIITVGFGLVRILHSNDKKSASGVAISTISIIIYVALKSIGL